jgi:hypothetical protein
MENFTIDKILLLTTFFVPGFIYLKAYRLFIAETKTDFSKDLYEAIGFSFINAIIFFFPLYLINKNGFISNHTLWYFLILFSIIVIAPILCALLFRYISSKKWFSRFMINPIKSAWDSFFSKRESYYVIVTLKNGRKIGGKYGLNSFSSTFPNPNEIFIEELWKLNENSTGFDSILEQTAGILITKDEISTIEFYI